MTLEDFFTLTEMKDGLMALSRVEELVSVMRKDKDNSLKNVGEAAGQWATVASTLAATENQESLDHFIRLDGLYFLDWWLQEAQKCSNDANESSVEESISVLLGALKKLPIDKERSLSSGIGETVKNLFGHKSYMVKERARALFNSWNPEKDNDTDPQDIEKDVGCHGGGVKPTDGMVALNSASVEASCFVDTHIGGSSDKDCHVEKPSGSECQHSRGSDNLQSENRNGITISFSNTKDDCQKTSSCVNKEDEFRENAQGPSITSMPVQESLPNMKEMSACPAERTSTGVDGSPAPADGNTEGRSSNVTDLKDLTIDVKNTDYTEGNPEKMSEKEKQYASTSYGREQVSTTDPPKVEQPLLQTFTLVKDDADEKFSPKKNIPSGLDDDTARLVSNLKGGVADHGMPKHSQTRLEGDSTDQAGGCYSSRCILRKPEFQDGEDIGAVNSAKELASEPLSKVGGGKDYASVVAISRPEMDTKLSKLDKRRSHMEYEYGVDDALEVARQVAKEVEREVVDYREQFCSSSDKISEAGVLQPSSPDSINAEHGQHILCPESETPNRQNLSGAGFSANGANHLIDAQNTDKAEDSMPDTDSSLVTEALQIPDDTTKKGLCDFDLNKEVCSEEMDHPRATCAVPITFVSASKAHAPSMPVAPLHFGGELGWKGSAATSAFRPASPRRTPDGEKTVSVDGSSQISKQRLLEKTPSIEGMSQSSKKRQSFLNIDLNVAEGDNDVGADLPQARQIPVSSELASRESSIEVSSRRAERLKFDLNRIDDHEDAPLSDWRREGRFPHNHRNGSASPASSLSSRQPSIRNINLNDNPSCFDNSSDRRPDASYSSIDMDSSGRIKQVDPVISIMGTRVEINRKDFALQTRSFLPNGRIAEFPISATMARPISSVAMQPSMAYAPGHALSGYNLAAGSCMSLPPSIYGLGSAPCVVDSRGTPVLPQLMGAPVDVLPSYSRQQFLMSMPSSQTGLNRIGFAEPSLDLNSGLTVMEAEGRESGGFRQLFTPGQGISMEGSVGPASQPLNLGIGVKRKEPDGVLDLYNVGYKHQTPWR